MRQFSLSSVIVAGAVWSATAQITVEVQLDQEQFLPAEPVRIAVRITNLSGQSLRLGQRPDWLAISLESRDGFIVPKHAEVPVLGPFVLESSQVATKRLELTPYYDLTRPGRYSVIATVRIPDWDQEFSSSPASFDIVEGTKLWEREFGVPAPAGPPEVRKYTLQQVNYLQQIKLYVRVSDAASGKVHRVVCLGPMVSFAYPEPRIDKQSHLHVLFQSGARSFLYCVVDPQGQVLKQETYQAAHTRPRLTVGEEGSVRVTGGVRRGAASEPVRAAARPGSTNTVKPANP